MALTDDKTGSCGDAGPAEDSVVADKDEVWAFQCPECRLGHGEFGRLARDDELVCMVCEDETGRQVRIQRWLSEAMPPAQPRLRLVRSA